MAIDVPPSDQSDAHGTAGELARLEPLMREALARAGAFEHDRAENIGEDLRILLRELCREAHAAGIPAEQLIVLLKRQWMTVNGGEHASRAQAQGALNLLVTACIEAYFEAPRRKRV